MPRKTKTEAQATREGLLDAAEEEFLEQGVSRTTLDSIAQRAGVTRGAIYWHFRNKTDLFNAMLDRVQLPMIELLSELHDDDESAPCENLRKLCLFALYKLVSDARHRRVHAILFHRCEHVDEINSSVQRQNVLINRMLASLTRYFKGAARRGDLRADVRPEIAARAVHVYMTGLYSDWLRNPEDFDLQLCVESLIDVLLGGLLREPPAFTRQCVFRDHAS
ncbi:MAG: TetR family transcriptional regulator [Pseudomonadota bacterium]|nr:TetR family transcriptional regulator [Pseudomonadota bacterium]